MRTILLLIDDKQGYSQRVYMLYYVVIAVMWCHSDVLSLMSRLISKEVVSLKFLIVGYAVIDVKGLMSCGVIVICCH
jgi:hypothetical protein